MTLPALTGSQVVRALQRAGLTVVRVSGSHHRLVHPDDPTRATTVPVHSGKTLKTGTLRAIIRQSGLSVEQFASFL